MDIEKWMWENCENSGGSGDMEWMLISDKTIRELLKTHSIVPNEPTEKLMNAFKKAKSEHLKKHGVDFELLFEQFTVSYKALLEAAKETE